MNTSQKSQESGFTVIELIVVGLVVALASVLVYVQINNLKIANQNDQRKTAINAMYYALEEVYYKQHHSYPQTLTTGTLPSVDPSLFTDPDGFTLGKATLTTDQITKAITDGSTDADTNRQLAALSAGKSPNYHYDATGCDTSGSNCTGYTLRADLLGEAEYTKKSRHS